MLEDEKPGEAEKSETCSFWGSVLSPLLLDLELVSTRFPLNEELNPEAVAVEVDT